jgi:hypothetical protein
MQECVATAAKGWGTDTYVLFAVTLPENGLT